MSRDDSGPDCPADPPTARRRYVELRMPLSTVIRDFVLNRMNQDDSQLTQRAFHCIESEPFEPEFNRYSAWTTREFGFTMHRQRAQVPLLEVLGEAIPRSASVHRDAGD